MASRHSFPRISLEYVTYYTSPVNMGIMSDVITDLTLVSGRQVDERVSMRAAIDVIADALRGGFDPEEDLPASSPKSLADNFC